MPGELSLPPSSPWRSSPGNAAANSPKDIACAALARSADRFNQMAAFTAELTARANGKAVETQAIIDRLTRHG